MSSNKFDEFYTKNKKETVLEQLAQAIVYADREFEREYNYIRSENSEYILPDSKPVAYYEPFGTWPLEIQEFMSLLEGFRQRIYDLKALEGEIRAIKVTEDNEIDEIDVKKLDEISSKISDHVGLIEITDWATRHEGIETKRKQIISNEDVEQLRNVLITEGELEGDPKVKKDAEPFPDELVFEDEPEEKMDAEHEYPAKLDIEDEPEPEAPKGKDIVEQAAHAQPEKAKMDAVKPSTPKSPVKELTALWQSYINSAQSPLNKNSPKDKDKPTTDKKRGGPSQ